MHALFKDLVCRRCIFFVIASITTAFTWIFISSLYQWINEKNVRTHTQTSKLSHIHIVNIHTHTHTHTHINTHTRRHISRVELQQCGAGEEAAGPWPHNHLLESDHQGLQHHCTNTPTLDPLAWGQGGGVKTKSVYRKRGREREKYKERREGKKREIKKWEAEREREGVSVFTGGNGRTEN